VREGFVNVPALVGTQPGAEFEFSFDRHRLRPLHRRRTRCRPDRVQHGWRPPRTLETFTHWSSGLHLPWALILDDQLKPGPHTAQVRLVASKTSSKTALRVFHLLLN
jgi:sialidase-1